MTPTFYRVKSFRFYVNSREETRAHIHIHTPDGEAKFWLEPQVELVVNYGIRESDLAEIGRIILEKRDEFTGLWRTYFKL